MSSDPRHQPSSVLYRRWLIVRGMAGALAALFASSVPCAAIVVLATELFDRWQRAGWAKAAIHGAVAAAVAVTVATAWTISKPHVRTGTRVIASVTVTVAFVMHAVIGLPAITILALAAFVGLLLPVERA